MLLEAVAAFAAVLWAARSKAGGESPRDMLLSAARAAGRISARVSIAQRQLHEFSSAAAARAAAAAPTVAAMHGSLKNAQEELRVSMRANNPEPSSLPQSSAPALHAAALAPVHSAPTAPSAATAPPLRYQLSRGCDIAEQSAAAAAASRHILR